MPLLTPSFIAIALFVHLCTGAIAPTWTAAERNVLRDLSLASLTPPAPDPSNRVADNDQAAALGERLFFDTRLSGNGRVACASCHLPERQFQDGTPLGRGMGVTSRRTMPIAATAHGAWFFWDGRADSQWAQALGPLESAVEHGGSRTLYVHVLAEHYRAEYVALFGPLPSLDGLPRHAGPVADSTWRQAWERIAPARREAISRAFANLGKSIAAYERRIAFTPTRFDRYVDAELAGQPHTAASAFSADEQAGLRLFIGKANCINCHNGPRFTDDHFHNTGVAASPGTFAQDSGRASGVRQALASEFRCTGSYSDAGAADCEELRFANADDHDLVRAFKTPSLRGIAERAPYMHAGQLATLADVIRHYDRAPAAPLGHSELRSLHLSATEQRQLAAFLQTLSSPVSAPARLRDGRQAFTHHDPGARDR